MNEPQDFSELERVLGMIAYVAKFIPHLSKLNVLLHELKKAEEWRWGSSEQNAYDKIKAEHPLEY